MFSGSHWHSTPSMGRSHSVSAVVITSGSVALGCCETTDKTMTGAAIASATTTQSSAKYFPVFAGCNRYDAIVSRLQARVVYASAANSATVDLLSDFNTTAITPRAIIMLKKPMMAEVVMANSTYPTRAAAAPTNA